MRFEVQFKYCACGEAFLIHMNEFELRLESDLRRLLNPIAAAPTLAWRQRADRHRTDDAVPGQPMPMLTLVAVAADAAAS
jgi:hypothetical protein